jgi:tetraacyldisaccharide 4'-kinase
VPAAPARPGPRLRAALEGWLWRQWLHRGLYARLMQPLAGLYARVAEARRLRAEGLRPAHVPGLRAVIVVGNLTVGGSGKTPMTAWLARRLRAAGYRVGVVSRGHGRAQGGPGGQEVSPEDDPGRVGDEPLLLARATGVPVRVDRDRLRAARALAQSGVEVVISDDGFQHHRLPRDLAILMVDGVRRFGNGLCLPAGPLREPPAGAARADFIVVTGATPGPGEYRMALEPEPVLRPVAGDGPGVAPEVLRGRVHAVAGIADPGRFFRLLEGAGFEVIAHPFPDHHRFLPGDIHFGDGLPVLMTEKDAVKCAAFADRRHWFWAVSARPEDALERALLARLEAIARPPPAG